uniref:Polymerase nucleotidyl transferase domain-containing protein n=2 Tax=Aromatoleum toluolicum TaxID=90060 RepID=A0ABX1NNH8_9RHOO|nr:hypothetical protein [Aromatoleum toluolicum]
MATDLSLRSILLEKLNRLINPAFEWKFTWTLLIAGLALIGYQRLVQLAGSIEIIRPEARIKLELSSGADVALSALGIVLVLLSCLFFYKLKFLSNVDKNRYKNLSAAAKDLRKLMEENRRIFLSFGPNSSAGSTGDIRHDPSTWQKLRRDTICPNNQNIKNILTSLDKISAVEKPLVEKMVSHIEAFEHHCKNPGYDYRENQFPREFADLISAYCARANRRTNKVQAYAAWLRERVDGLNVVEQAHIFGSALFGEETSDVDLVVKSPASDISEVRHQSDLWKQVAADFFAKFNLRLHTVVFSQLESDSYAEFISKIGQRKKVI